MIDLLFAAVVLGQPSDTAPTAPAEQTVPSPVTETAAEEPEIPRECRRVLMTGSRLNATWDCGRTRNEDNRRDHDQDMIARRQSRSNAPAIHNSPNRGPGLP